MSLTGLPYLWENELDALTYPQYRNLPVQSTRLAYQAQMEKVEAAFPGSGVTSVEIDPAPDVATTFIMGNRADPVSVAVNPYTGEILGSQREWTRLPYLARELHGLTMIAPYGSWLLEFLACWGIVLCVTGVILWWPRGKEKIWGVFLPRLAGTGRTRWRDIHSVLGFYVAGVLVLYLVTGLPWTAFWGGQVFKKLLPEDQRFPMIVTPFSGLQSAPPATAEAKPLDLDYFVKYGQDLHAPGKLVVNFPPMPTGTMHVRNQLRRALSEQHFQLDRYTGKPVAVMNWEKMPATQKVVALGVNMHEGGLFGRANQIGATVLTGIFMFLSLAGVIMWWKRRPRGKLDFNVPVRATGLNPVFRGAIILLGVLLPMLGLTFLVAAVAMRFRPSAA